jgi:hypothetical protein
VEILARRHTARLWAGLTAALISVPWTSVGAQNPTAATLKAAFVYNFVKFTEWPQEALGRGERLSLCVLGDTSVADALERTIEVGGVDGHPLTVEMLGSESPTRACHLLYVSGLDGTRTGQLLAGLRKTPAFTVSDSDHFAEMGGVAQLIQENSRLRFAINVDAAQRAHLTISSRLLTLAQIVKDSKGGFR